MTFHRREGRAQRRVGLLQAEGLGVERSAEPVAPLAMVGMLGVREGFFQFGIAPDAAAILRRAPPPAGHAGREDEAVRPGDRLLHRDDVVPTVAEIVGVVA